MIYITMATVPDRWKHEAVFGKGLDALLNQDTTEPYKIILNIPWRYKNYPDSTLPDWLWDKIHQSQGKIIVLNGDKDYGPITNLVYPLRVLKLDPEDILIVVDDDHLYMPNMVSHHLMKLKQYPDKHAICYRGNQPMELRTWYENGKKLGKFYNSCVLFPTRNDIYLRFPDHWHSVSYRRKFLKDDLLDDNFLSITWNNDMLMALYAWTHDFYFLCAAYEGEQDYRPVNYDGRGAHAFPVEYPLPFDGNSGCNLWRQSDKRDLSMEPAIQPVYAEKPIIEWHL